MITPNPDKPIEAKWKSRFIGELNRTLGYFSHTRPEIRNSKSETRNKF